VILNSYKYPISDHLGFYIYTLTTVRHGGLSSRPTKVRGAHPPAVPSFAPSHGPTRTAATPQHPSHAWGVLVIPETALQSAQEDRGQEALAVGPQPGEKKPPVALLACVVGQVPTARLATAPGLALGGACDRSLYPVTINYW
jgi:hypothetical protein